VRERVLGGIARRERQSTTVKNDVEDEGEMVTWQTAANARETSRNRKQNHNSWKKQKLFNGRT
jgi:hypothetical protein